MMPLQVPIVVTAEDGVTSQRYYVVVTRAAATPAPAPAPESAVISADSLGPVSELYSVPLRTGTSDGRLGAFGAIAPSGSSSSSGSDSGNMPVAAPVSGQLSFSFTPSSEQVREGCGRCLKRRTTRLLLVLRWCSIISCVDAGNCHCPVLEAACKCLYGPLPLLVLLLEPSYHMW